jgi:hypothetical protein
MCPNFLSLPNSWPRCFSERIFGCESLFNRLFGVLGGYGKSPCFLEGWFLRLLGPDWLVYNLMVDDGVENLD